MSTLKFSGHETFQCRHFWLKKGYDFIQRGGIFNSNEALIALGVGKNMVSSINFWLKAYKVTSNTTGEVTEFGEYIFGKDGRDPYLEDIGTLFLLHFNIFSNSSQASIYELTFDEFRKTRISSEFTADQLYDFVCRKLRNRNNTYSEKLIKNDIRVFLRTYQTSSKQGSKSIEDDYASILIGLKLVYPVQDVFIDGEQVYRINYGEQVELNVLLFLFTILDVFPDENSISVSDIQNRISDRFLCNREGTENKLSFLNELGLIVYKQDAGRKEIQLKDRLDKWSILDKYYAGV